MARIGPTLRGLATGILVAAFLTSPRSAGEVLFRSLEYPAEAPISMAVADLDGDGDRDVVLGLRNVSHVSVRLNLGDGRFAPEETYPSGGAPRYVALGDMDDDGDQDIVAANRGDDTITLLWNKGDGTFMGASSGAAVLPSASLPKKLRLADFDGDTLLDVVVVHESAPAAVLLNDGTGTLSAPALLAFGGLGIDVADVNADGHPDVVTTGVDLNVALNDGAGGFATSSTFDIGMGLLQGVALGDLDDDGDRDAVTVDFTFGEVVVMHNDGTGSFSPGPRYPVGPFPWDVVVTDLNEDGRLDVAVASGSGEGRASVLLNDGTGLLAPAIGQPLDEASGLAIIDDDFDGDGFVDLAVVSLHDPFVTGSFHVLLGDGTGDVGGRTRIDLPSRSRPRSIASADLDGDDAPDLVVADSEENRYIPYFRDAGAFVLGIEGRFGSGFRPLSLVLEDIDGDADVDVVAGSQLGFHGVGLNLGGRRFDNSRLLEIGGKTPAIAAARLDGNASVDLAIPRHFGESTSTIGISLNDGGGFFPDPPIGVDLPPSRLQDLAVADVDLDGDVDIVTAHRAGEVVLVENLGAGEFAAATTVGTYGAFSSVLLRDLDGDLAPEVILADVVADAVLILPNLGAGNFGPPTSYLVGEEPFSLAAGDLDNDGAMDIAVVNQEPRNDYVTLLMGDGAGGFSIVERFAIGEGIRLETFESEFSLWPGHGVALADLDRDGDLDMAVANAGEGSVSLLDNRLIGPEAEAAFLGAFESVSTDTEGDGATPTDPVETTVQSPSAGLVRISEGPISTDAPRGFSFLGHQVNIDAPPASVANPLIITFLLDASQVPPGVNAFGLRVFRDSMLVGSCLGAPGAAEPDPCISVRVDLAGGDILIVVRTSLASRWNLGLQDPLNFVIALDFTTIGGPDSLVFNIPSWQLELLTESLGDFDQDGSEELPVSLGGIEASATGALLGEVTMRLRSPNDSPFQPSFGLLEEPFNQVPLLLELQPFSAGTGGSFSMDLYFEFDIPGLNLVAHNEAPKRVQGSVGEWPPFLDQQLVGLDFVTLVNQGGGLLGLSLAQTRLATGLQSPPPRVQDLEWTGDKQGLVWSDDPNSVAFEVYRGHDSLLAGLTDAAPEACLQATVQVPAAGGLTQRPAQGELIWYLVTPVGPFESGGGGTNTLGPRRLDSPGACGTACAHDKCEVGAALEPACDVCVAVVCEDDPSCCEAEWDATCVERVRTRCDNLTCPESQGQCAHPLCVVGALLTNGCDVPPLDTSCVAIVCGADSFCCGNSWDALCAGTVTDLCGYDCS